MATKKIFLASSAELKADRDAFEILVNRKNKDWQARGVFLELVVWEDFLDAMSKTRLQDEYNRAIRDCDLFVMLFFTKVGRYTEEEFDTAFGQFKATGKPFVFTYFKDAPVDSGSADLDDLTSLLAFKKKLAALGHFHTTYRTVEELQLKFGAQLDKLAASGFIELDVQEQARAASAAVSYRAQQHGDGAIAQGPRAQAAGRGGMVVGGDNSGNMNTGTQTNIDTGGGAHIGGSVNTGGGNFTGRDSFTNTTTTTTGAVSPRELEPLFAALLAAVARQAPAAAQTEAMRQVEQIEAETAKGRRADDGRLGRMIEGLVGLVPGAVGAVVSTFATPILGGIAGPVTKAVLDRIKAG